MKVIGLAVLILKLTNAIIKQSRNKWIIKNSITTIQQQFFLHSKSRSHDSHSSSPRNNPRRLHDDDDDNDDDNLRIELWEKSKSPSLEELFERDGVMYLCAQPHTQEKNDIDTIENTPFNKPFTSPKFESDMFLNNDYDINTSTSSSSSSSSTINNNIHNTKKKKKKILTLPIMPFESPLFIGSKEFLYIYEMRFRTMMNSVEFQHDNFLGRCYLSENGEVGLVGSLCKVVEKKKMEDGKGFFIIEAVQRFKIRKVIQSEPFLTAEVELDYEDDIDIIDNTTTTTTINSVSMNTINKSSTITKKSAVHANILLCEQLCHDVYTLLKIYLRIHKIQKNILSSMSVGMGVGIGGTVSSGTRGGGSSSSRSSSSTAVPASADSSIQNNEKTSSSSSSSSSSSDTSNISFQPAVHNNRPRSGLNEADNGRSRHQAFSHACANILSTEPSILQQIFQSTSIAYRLHGVKRILTEAVDELSTLMIEDGILTKDLLSTIIMTSTSINDDDSDLLPPDGQPQDVSLETEVDSRFRHFPDTSSGSSSDYISSDGSDCSSDEGSSDMFYSFNNRGNNISNNNNNNNNNRRSNSSSSNSSSNSSSHFYKSNYNEHDDDDDDDFDSYYYDQRSDRNYPSNNNNSNNNDNNNRSSSSSNDTNRSSSSSSSRNNINNNSNNNNINRPQQFSTKKQQAQPKRDLKKEGVKKEEVAIASASNKQSLQRKVPDTTTTTTSKTTTTTTTMMTSTSADSSSSTNAITTTTATTATTTRATAHSDTEWAGDEGSSFQ